MGGEVKENPFNILKEVLIWIYSYSWMDPCVADLQDSVQEISRALRNI